MGVPRKLTFALAGLMATQAVMGLTAPDQYRDVEWIKATWFGNDWLTLVVAVPLLLISGIGAQRGSARAFLLWAGGVGYAVYNYAFYLLGAALNMFFPFYVVLLVLAAITLILTLGRFDPSSIGLNVRRVAPVPLNQRLFRDDRRRPGGRVDRDVGCVRLCWASDACRS